MYFPDELRLVRKQFKVSQMELAVWTGLSQGMISRIENKKVNPRLSVLKRISDFFETIEKNKSNTIDGIMSRPVRYIGPEDKLSSALYLMKRQGYSQIPVIKNGTCVGSINEKIIVQHVLGGESLSRLKKKSARKIMARALPSVEIGSDFVLVISLLKNNPAILVKEDKVVKGIITRSDIL